MSIQMPVNNLQVEIAGNQIDLKPVKEKKPVKRRAQKEYNSPFEAEGTVPYYGSKPLLVKWKDWILMCKLIRESDQFKKQYAKENFKPNDLEESGFIYPVYTKDPQEIKNLEGTVIEVIPGIYDEERTLVLPPKFTFAIYRRYFLSHPDLQKYLTEEAGANAKIINFKKYDFITTSAPRGEQVELAELAKASLNQQKYFKGIVQCPPGWGKFQYFSDLLATPNGWVKMQDIKIGDEVFSRDGTPTKVVNIYPQGKQDVYEFTFGDNTKTRAGLDHLWKVWDTDNKKWRVITTKEILSKNYARPEKDKRYGDKSNGMRYKYFIPLCEPVQYKFDDSNRAETKGLLPLQHCFHPYALGLMLGDGSFRMDGNSFGFSDKFRKNTEELFKSLRANGYIDDISITDNPDDRSITFRSKKLKELAKIFRLDKKYSIEKHIPKEYLYASVESRKLLLEGLIATDGYVRTKSSWSYSTSSPQLRDDVCELARSLGYYVTIKINENNTYVHNGEKKQTEHANYELCINYEKERKAITHIQKLDYQEDAQCIAVEHPEHLYLTNDYIVTHNTFISINIGSEVKGQVLIVVPNKLLKDQWIQSILEFTNLEEDDIGFLQGSDLDKLTRQNKNKRPVLIALIQSLDSQLQRNTLEDLISFYGNVAAVFYDETHTSGAADGYAKTTGMFTTYNIIGLSATPYKKDKNLFQLYTGIGPIVYVSTHQNLIPACNMHLLPVPIAPKKQAKLYDTFQKTNYNFFMSELENFLFEVDAYFVYLAEWLIYRHKQGHSSVVLFKTNKMLEKLERFVKERLNGLDLSIVILTNETARHNKQKLSTANIILSNFKMFSAGADVPHLSCVFFASMIMGKIPIIQTLGRITRKYSNKIQEVQAHFLLVKFIYPLFSNREPHITIADAVKTQYPSAQFKWDNEFIKYFEEKKNASKNLNANSYQQFQQNQQSNIPVNPNQKGDYLIDANYTSGNRLDVYRQQHIQNHYVQNNGDQFQRPVNTIPGMGYQQ